MSPEPPAEPPETNPWAGRPVPQPPAGYRRYGGAVDPEMTGHAVSALSQPWGSFVPFTHSSGKQMGSLLETHHNAAKGYHKGASLFIRS